MNTLLRTLVCAAAAALAIFADGGQPARAQSNILDRVKIETAVRNAPDRELPILIHTPIKYVDGVFGIMASGAGVNGGVRFTTADKVPGVEFSLWLIGSTRLYSQVDVEAYVPKVVDENTHADARFRYRRRREDNFFGLGPNAPSPFPPPLFTLASKDYETNYEIEQRQYAGSLYHDFTHDLQAGVYVEFDSASTYTGANEDDPPIGNLFSDDPADVACTADGCPDQIYVPGLFVRPRTLAEGVYAKYDSRDNSKGLTRGAYLYGRFANHDGIGESLPANQDFGWLQGTVDARGYIPLGGDLTSFAVRYAGEWNRPKGGSQVPYYDMARLGGRTTLRGFDTYRFYGENSILFQAEVRRTVWRPMSKNTNEKSKHRGFDVILFGDTGQVWGVYGDLQSGVAADELARKNFEVDFGVGAQYRLSEEFVLRMDVGHSNEDTRVYFTLSRGF